MIARLMRYFFKQDDEYKTPNIVDALKEITPRSSEEEASWLGIG